MKGQINKFLLVLKFEIDNSKEYKDEVIQDNAIYTKKVD